MQAMKSRYNAARRWLVFWTLFIGIGAIAGSSAMLMDPSGKLLGMDAMLPYFQVLPFADVLFRDFTFSGYALLIVNGLTNIMAAFLLLRKKKIGVILGGVFGVTLMLWICIQFYMFPLNFMSTIYFFFGLCQAITGYAAWVFYRQEHFRFDVKDYANVGANPDSLVVFFSRMGYVKKKAYEEADRTGAQIYEIKACEKTSGTSGFWWCGRYGVHRWKMPIEPVSVDLTAFRHVTICTPIWVFSLPSPVRSFCEEARGKILEAEYMLVHFSRGKYEKAAREMDAILGLKGTPYRSIVCRMGKYI